MDPRVKPEGDAVGKGGSEVCTRSKAEVIRTLFAAYKSRDREVFEALLTDDFTFTSPYDDATDKATYFVRCWPNSERIRAHVLEKICEQGNEVVVLYKCITADGNEFRNTELFTFEGDQIRRVDVFFGASYRDGAFVHT
jgi:ketosteroid isomerase-like protein